MKLEDWLKQTEISVSDFARMIGVKKAKTVYRYLNRERIPEREVMSRITKATKGIVTADSFYQ